MKKILLSVSIFIFIFVSILVVKSPTVNAAESNQEENLIDRNEEEVPENKLNTYFEPAYSDVEYSLPSRGASTNDQYENNNSFEDAHSLFSNNSGEPSDQNDYIFATLHRDPWYYLFWRDIDEDYFYFDVLGDATINIDLTNIPYDCDYDIEFYRHNNIIEASNNSVTKIKGSYKSNRINENITLDITPGTYYIRVYSYKGYSGDDSYKLSYSLTYNRSNPTSITDLRYNKGAKAAVWTSDFNPFEIKPFNLEGREYVGFISYSTELGYLNYYANHIHHTMNARANGDYITQSVIYIWDLEWRNTIRLKLISMADQLEDIISANQEFVMKFEQYTGAIGGAITALDIYALSTSNAVLGIISTIGGTVNTAAELLIPMMFPEKWETNGQTALNYIQRLIAALEISSGTSSNEIVKIDFRYNYESEYKILYQQTHYYLNFAYSPDNAYNFLYDLNYIPAYNTEAYTFGKTYGLRNFDDLDAFYSGNPVTNLPDVNTDTPTEAFLEASYSGYLNTGQYFWYEFTAPYLGCYTFATYGSTDTYGEIFLSPVAGNSIIGRIAYDDDSGTGNNFTLDYEMEEGTTIYIRVRGYNWTSTGAYSFLIIGQEIPITNAYLNYVYSGTLTINKVYWYKFTAPSNGEYIFETTGNTDTYGEIFNSPVAGKTYTGLIVENDDSGDKNNFRIIHQMNEGTTVYIRVRGYNWHATGTFNFYIRNVKELSIVLDPANMALHGTEVTMNNGIIGGTTMTIGYTRNAYLENGAPSLSRLDYFWTVSNANIAKVSAYGTITALSPGIVEVIATYKEDTSYIAKVLVTVYPESSSLLHLLEFTTDNRESPTPAGTEVTLNGGTPGEFTIHKGFTRFINFDGGAPNPLLQDYIWSSNNSAVLSVDMYGIVTAHAYNITVPTLVTITCVYKYNSLFQGTVTFIVYP